MKKLFLLFVVVSAVIFSFAGAKAMAKDGACPEMKDLAQGRAKNYCEVIQLFNAEYFGQDFSAIYWPVLDGTNLEYLVVGKYGDKETGRTWGQFFGLMTPGDTLDAHPFGNMESGEAIVADIKMPVKDAKILFVKNLIYGKTGFRVKFVEAKHFNAYDNEWKYDYNTGVVEELEMCWAPDCDPRITIKASSKIGGDNVITPPKNKEMILETSLCDVTDIIGNSEMSKQIKYYRSLVCRN